MNKCLWFAFGSHLWGVAARKEGSRNLAMTRTRTRDLLEYGGLYGSVAIVEVPAVVG
jgi:hypothetical protein